MIRLWHRIGVFRMLSVGLLVLGVVAASYLSAGRQSQERVTKAAQAAAQTDQDEIRALRQAMQERERVSAASRDAQREAQAKADAAAAEAAASAKAAEEAARKTKPSAKPSASTSTGPAKPPPPFGPIPTSCNGNTGNRAIGCTLMLEAGFGLDHWNCLDKLWTKESGWNHRARNKGSGAYGIPQALPEGKLAKYGADYANNPVPQIKWGLDYIKSRYKTPCGAWSYFQSKGYY